MWIIERGAVLRVKRAIVHMLVGARLSPAFEEYKLDWKNHWMMALLGEKAGAESYLTEILVRATFYWKHWDSVMRVSLDSVV